MRTLIDIEEWHRKEHYRFFSQFDEPFFGVTVEVDCSLAYRKAKERQQSFFLYYLYRALKAANEVEAFRYRIINHEVYLFDKVNASPTIIRPNGTFGFAYLDYEQNEDCFSIKAEKVISEVRQSTDLTPSTTSQNVIQFSTLPWLNFTSISHARNFRVPDSCPKVTFGKMIEKDGRKMMPVSIHLHHGLADGFDAGVFVDTFEQLMDAKE